MFRHMFVNNEVVNARKTNNNLSILSYRCNKCIVKSGPMLHRLIKARPGSRTMIKARRLYLSRTTSAFRPQLSVSFRMVIRRNLIRTIVKQVRHRDRRFNVLLLFDNSANLNNFHQGLTRHTIRTILRICHHRIHINSLLRVSISKDVTHVQYHKDRVNRIFRTISNFFRENCRYLLRDFDIYSEVDYRCISNQEYSIKMLFRQRKGRKGRTRRCGRRQSGTQGRQTICGGSRIRFISFLKIVLVPSLADPAPSTAVISPAREPSFAVGQLPSFEQSAIE